MTKFILHGGFTTEENESNYSFFKEFLRDVPNNGIVLFVYFAARTDNEIPEKFKRHIELCTDLFPEKNLSFKIATRESFLLELHESDAVLFSGGSTSKLLRILKSYPNLKHSLQEKTIAGSSAGAYILATIGTSHAEGTIREGLGFVPIRLICHYESSKLPPNSISVDALKNTSSELELITLRDFEWKIITL